MPVKRRFHRETALPPCSLDVAALEAIELAVPGDFEKCWRAQAGPSEVSGNSVEELAAEIPDWARIDHLSLDAHRPYGEGALASVRVAIYRFAGTLTISADDDPGPVVWAEERIVGVCRAHRRWWGQLVVGWTTWAFVIAGLVMLWGGLLSGLAIRDRSVPGAVLLWVVALLGIMVLAFWYLSLFTLRLNRLPGIAGQVRPLFEWRQFVPNVIVQLGVGLLLLGLGIVIGKACE